MVLSVGVWCHRGLVLDAVFADSWQGKDLKAVVARVIEEYAKISHLSSRDAKHAYLELVAAAEPTATCACRGC